MGEPAKRFTLRVGEIYKHIEKGLESIDQDLSGATRRARFSNLPESLLRRWLPRTAAWSKHAEVFWKDAAQQAKLTEAALVPKLSADSAVLPSQWYQLFIGEKLHMGEVLTETGLWHLLYRDDGEIRRIMANTDNKCNPCIWAKNFMMRFQGEHLYCTVYDRIEGLKQIAARAQKAEVFRSVVVPPFLLKDLIPPARKADYKFILSRRDPLAKFFGGDDDVRYGSSAKIYYVYGEQEATVGSVRLDADYFSIFWRGNEVFNVMQFNNRICANCLSRVFDTAWKYSERI